MPSGFDHEGSSYAAGDRQAASIELATGQSARTEYCGPQGLHLAIAVPPELVSYWRSHFATGREGFRPCSVRIGHIQRQPYRASRAVGFASEFREDIIQHHYGVRDANARVQQTPIR